MQYLSKGWDGLMMSMTMSLEGGSLAASLGDLGLLPQTFSIYVLNISSVLGIGITLHGLLTSTVPDAKVGFNAVAALITGAMRIQEGYTVMAKLKKNKD